MKNQNQRVSATEATRDFSGLLERVEAGGEAIVERRSLPVAVLAPPTSAPRRISECFLAPLGRPSAMADPGFADDLEEIIQANPAKEPPSWG